MKIEPCARADSAAVLRLLNDGQSPPAARAELLRAEFERVYFDNPWADPELVSLVCRIDGDVVGFLGVTPRPMLAGDRRLRVAVSSNFKVGDNAPERQRPFIAARMIKMLMAGPQDLCFADGATDVSRRIWEGSGGSLARVLGLDWFHAIRPISGLLELAGIGRRGRAGLISSGMQRGAAVADLAAAPLLEKMIEVAAATTVPLDRGALVSAVRELRAPLKPAYEEGALAWLLDSTAAQLASDGKTLERAVVGDDGTMHGWFVLVRRGPRLVDVMQLAVLQGDGAAVLAAAIDAARGLGAALIRGHALPAQYDAYRRCVCLMNSGRWVLVHAHEPGLLEPLGCGTAWVSALDGERWIGAFKFDPT